MTLRSTLKSFSCLLLLVVVACDVESTSAPTGGVDLGAPPASNPNPDAVNPAAPTPEPGPADPKQPTTPPGSTPDDPVACARGVVVSMTDYLSTNLAILQTDGITRSGSFLSSGSKDPKLGLALSGDLVLPSSPAASGRIVLLDRFGSNVITWVDPATAGVVAQLPVGTGFESNPQDYLEIDAAKAYVTRYESNAKPGQAPFDGGGDILVINHQTPAIQGSIPLPAEGDFLPRPTGMLRLSAETIVVTLQRLSADFQSIGDSVLVGVSTATDTVMWTLPVTGLVNCSRPTRSPNGRQFALACAGRYDAETDVYASAQSDIVVFDATSNPPSEVKRYGVGQQLKVGLQPSVEFASGQLLLGKTYGNVKGTLKDKLFSLDTESGVVTQLYEATKGSLQLGDIYCSPGCGNVCLVADAESNLLRRWVATTPSLLEAMSPVRIEENIGLPPRVLGGF